MRYDPRVRTALSPLVILGLVAWGCGGPASAGPTTPNGGAAAREPVRSNRAADKGLEIGFEIGPEVRRDRVPMRTVALHFHNTSSDPIRVYLPRGEAFRASISTLVFRSGAHVFLEPEPQPHGVVIEEDDFPLLAPGEEKTFEQTFTLDPMVPGPGVATARRAGFEDGETVDVRWTYENTITRWAGGQMTLDGPTKSLFGGGEIPHIWSGKLSVEARWVVR